MKHANTKKIILALLMAMGMVIACLPSVFATEDVLSGTAVHFDEPVEQGRYRTVSGIPEGGYLKGLTTYTVHFDGNTATSGSMDDVTYRRFELNSLPANKYAKTGYHFTGWSTEKVGQNILNGTASPKALAAAGADTTLWSKGQFRPASSGEGTREPVTLTDAPASGISGGFHLAGTGHTDIAQDGVPMTAKKVYTYSLYVKGTGTVRLQVGSNKKNNYVQHVEKANASSWKRVSMTFIMTDDYLSDGASSVYVCTKNAADFTVCGLKLEEGGYATDYVEKGSTGWQFQDESPLLNLPTDGSKPVTLYALWAPNYCTVHFDGNGADSGSMGDQYVPYGGKIQLTNNGFSKTDCLFGGWNTRADGSGTHYANVGELSNSVDADTALTLYAEWLPSIGTVTTTRLYNVKPGETELPVYSCQGSCVVKKNGKSYVVNCFVRNAGEYLFGNMADYTSSVVMTDLATGETVNHKEGINLGHANGMCYNPETDHFYIARYGDARWQTGIVELDWDLNEVAVHEVEGAANIGNLAWYNGYYYGQLSAGGGNFVLCVMDSDFNLVAKSGAMEGYEDNNLGQGMAIATDGHYIYTLSMDFNAPDWRLHQRLNIYHMDGSFVGMKAIDVSEELEDLSIVDGVMYATSNANKTSNVYRLTGALMPEDEITPEDETTPEEETSSGEIF